jgi:hypothetical protein
VVVYRERLADEAAVLASKTAPRRLELVSSGQKSRKFAESALRE